MARNTEASGDKTKAQDPPNDPLQQESGTATTGEDEAKPQGDGFADLREQNKALRALLGECAKISDAEAAESLQPRLAEAWAQHVDGHRLLYDAAVESGLQEFPLLTETAIDTDLVSFLLGRDDLDLDGALDLAVLRVAARLIEEIIEREEKPRSGLFAKATAAGVDPAALGRRIRACMTALPGRGGDRRPQLRYLMANQEEIMPRNSNMPERDERGRFMSDDDDRSRSGRGSGRYDDDHERDSRGRYTSSRDDDRGGRSRYDDDRDRDSRGRFTSDDDRSSSRGRSSRRDDDEDRRYSASRRDDDDRRSYSSRDRDDNYSRDRGQSGWFGDSRGHAEAARMGWEHRRDDDDDDRHSSRGRSSRRDDDDDRRYSSSRRYDDDRRSSSSRSRDDDYSRDRGQGGWFGDSEGHAEAARRGWDNRRDEDDDDRRYSSRGRR